MARDGRGNRPPPAIADWETRLPAEIVEAAHWAARKHKIPVDRLFDGTTDYTVRKARAGMMWQLRTVHGFTLQRIATALRIHHATVHNAASRYDGSQVELLMDPVTYPHGGEIHRSNLREPK